MDSFLFSFPLSCFHPPFRTSLLEVTRWATGAEVEGGKRGLFGWTIGSPGRVLQLRNTPHTFAPGYNEPRYNEFLTIRNSSSQPR